MFRKKYFTVIISALIVFSIFVINYKNLYSRMRNFAGEVCKPVIEVSHFLFYNATDGFSKLAGAIDMYQTHEAMKQELLVLRDEVVRMAELEAENSRILKLLNFSKDTHNRHIGAQIIGRDVSSWTHWVIINVGKNDGIVKDMPLIAPGGLVGRVVSVSSDSSKCVLVIDHQSKASALIQRTRDTGIVVGQGNGLLRLEYLSLDADVKVGDIVVTSGLGGIFPKGITIGEVTTVGAERNGLHLFAEVKPYIDFKRIEEVVCLS